jgi:hypothetical protein
MQMDVPGRLRNLPALTKTTILMPIFEAVVNSIQAIHNQPQGGQILVEFRRSNKQLSFPLIDGQNPIEHCVITDDGEGFTSSNYDSFNTSDSMHKVTLGGKGVGRFVWLKAFDRVEVESDYFDGAEWKVRRFAFVPVGDGIADLYEGESTRKRHHTVISLKALKPEYANLFPRSLERIAEDILEHCMLYFLRGVAPEIEVFDEQDRIPLHKLYAQEYRRHSAEDQFMIGSHTFTVDHVRRFGQRARAHRLHLCANFREVVNEQLKHRIPALTNKLVDDSGRAFVCSSFVSGDFLDSRVDPHRDRFNIPKGDHTLDTDLGIPTETEIVTTAVDIVKKHMEPLLRPIQEGTTANVAAYVRRQAPRYRPLLKHHPEVMENIPPNASEAQMEEHLNKAYYDYEHTIRKLGEDLAYYPMTNKAQFDALQTKYHEYIDGVNNLGKATLAQHVVYRRLMLTLLANSLKLDSEGNYKNEAMVHGMIFPLRTTSDDVLYEQQNLWIIDERLSYHWFLASDKYFRSARGESDGKDEYRPDIIIFDRPHAFIDAEATLSSVVIIEFKKPMREKYDEGEDPITQVFKYMDKLRTNKEQDCDGRPIRIAEGARFYCYIICDITPKIEFVAKQSSLTKSPDNERFFGYNQPYSAYIEVISYTALVADAEKRNRILFDKLNLPRPNTGENPLE